MSLKRPWARIGLLLVLAGGLLQGLSARTEVLFADGLRYVRQAQTLDRGAWKEGLRQAVDHPAYPLAIVAAHRLLGGDGPEGGEMAAQAGAIAAGGRDRRGRPARRPPLPRLPRALRRLQRLARLPPDVCRAADRPRLRRRA